MVLPEKDLEAVGGSPFNYAEQFPSQMSEDEAFRLLNTKMGVSDRGRDPVHLALHKTWFVGIAYLLDLKSNQHLNSLGDIDPNLLPRETTYSANHILRHVMTQVARLAGIAPEFENIPITVDIDDVFAAEVGERLLDYLNMRQKWHEKRLEFCWWLVTCGHAFIYNDWDPSIGELRRKGFNPLDKSEEFDLDQMDTQKVDALRSLGGVRESRDGDLTKRILSPFEVTVPRGFRGPSLENCPWLAIEEEVDPGWIWQRYPDKAPQLVRDDFSLSTDAFYFRRIPSLVNRYGFTMPSSGLDSAEVITIRSLWIPPSGWCPDGALIRGTKTMLLESGPHPMKAAGLDPQNPDFLDLRYPINGARYSLVPGRYWGQGLIENLIGPQAQYNIAADQLRRQGDGFSRPTVITPNDNKLQYDGDVWTYDSNKGKPELWNPPTIGQGQTLVKEQAMSDMRMIAAQSDPSRDYPSGTRAGNMVALFQEQDETTMNPTVTELWSAYEGVARRDLSLAWKLWKRERMIRVIGEAKAGHALAFKGAMLNGNVFVKIKPQSMRMHSRAAAMEMVSNLGSLGLLDPMNPQHAEAALDAIQFKGLDHLFQGMRLDRERARQENLMFQRPGVDRQGNILPWPQVDDHDDHMVHIESHRNFKMTDAYERLPPIVQLAFDSHLRMHEQFLADIMMASQQMQAGPAAPPAGAGQPPGEASQPAQKQPTPGTKAPSGRGTEAS